MMRALFAATLFGLAAGVAAVDAQVLLQCRGGMGDPRCSSPNGIGVAINVPPSTLVYQDNAPCRQGNTDRLLRGLLSAAAAERTRAARMSTPQDLAAFWRGLRSRAATLGGGELVELLGRPGGMQTSPRGRGAAMCQAVIVAVDVPPSKIRAVEFRAQQGQDKSAPCFTAQMSGAGAPFSQSRTAGTLALSPSSGPCAIGWSGWEAAAAIPDGQGGTLVGSVFKNWSANLGRTAQLWVWF